MRNRPRLFLPSGALRNGEIETNAIPKETLAMKTSTSSF